MKKISIIFAVLAIFMLLASCSNAAGGVDLAGNPVELTGTWSGSVAYESDVQYSPVLTILNSGDGRFDYTGTWTYEKVLSAPVADYDEVNVNSYGTTTTTTTKFIDNAPTITTKVTRVITVDGGYTQTTVYNSDVKARPAITVPANTVYMLAGVSYPEGYPLAAVESDSQTTTIIETVSYTIADDGTMTETTTTVTEIKRAGTAYATPYTDKTTVTQSKVVTDYKFNNFNITVNNPYSPENFYLYREDFTQTETGKEAEEYFDDIVETVTFVVANDGTYTLTSTIVCTQAAREAAAETDTLYAVSERAEATSTITYNFTGTVAAWEVPATTNSNASMKMVLSSRTMEQTSSMVNGDFDGELQTTGINKLAASGEKTIRFFNGKGKKDDVVKTRMYVSLDTNGFSGTNDECVIILDKAAEEE